MISALGVANLANETRGKINPETGKTVFEHRFREALGLDDPKTHRRYVAESGSPYIGEKPIVKPTKAALDTVIYGLLGADPLSVLTKENCIRAAAAEMLGQVVSAETIVPSAFANISPFNSAATGLLEAKIIEGFMNPAFIGDMLAETVPTRKMSEKLIGLTNIGDEAIERKPGVPHKQVGFSEVYTTTPDLVNRGLAIQITREAQLFDITGQLMDRAEQVGKSLGLRKEYNIIDIAIGYTNSYNRNGTSYNTYATSGTPWVNKVTKVFADWTDYDEALAFLGALTDPDTGEPIDVATPQLLVMPHRWMSHNKILTDSTLEKRTDTAANVSGGGNPVRGIFTLLPQNRRVYDRVSGARTVDGNTGLNAGATHGPEYWYLGDFKKAFKYHQALPLTVVRATPDSYTMADQGLIAAVFADEMGRAASVAPWNVAMFISA